MAPVTVILSPVFAAVVCIERSGAALGEPFELERTVNAFEEAFVFVLSEAQTA